MAQGKLRGNEENLACGEFAEPFFDVRNDLVTLVVVEQKMEAFRVEALFGLGGFGEVFQEDFHILGIGEDVLSAIENVEGNIEAQGGLFHPSDHVAESSEQAQGMAFDVVGVFLSLFRMNGVFGNLDV